VRTTNFIPIHQYFFDGSEHVDPLKEANAQAARLANHTTTLAYEYARQGRDWEDALYQRADELALMKQLGLSLPGMPMAPTDSQNGIPEPDLTEESFSDTTDE
ncbi:MAG: hypothetical protein SGI77_24440, partial [Pirellulaceae bacterium]|nr:hypothetical protein [Pirellulaceae bacterium]